MVRIYEGMIKSWWEQIYPLLILLQYFLLPIESNFAFNNLFFLVFINIFLYFVQFSFQSPLLVPGMAPQNSTLLQQEIESYHNDEISSTATSEKITPGSCMQDLVSNYSPISRPKSAGDPRYSDTRPHRPYYVENVVTVEDIFIPPSTQKKSIFAKNTIKNGKTCDEEVCTIHNHLLFLPNLHFSTLPIQ